MDIMNLLLTRRSIRKYSNQDVSEEQVNLLIKAAMYAPSAGNQQPWHFMVLRDKKIFDKIQEFHPYSKMLTGASVAVLICGDMSLETKTGYWTIDCSAATENMLIAAHGLGLGACWLGVYPRQERMNGFSVLFTLPEKIMPFSLVSIGFPAENKAVPERFNTSRIHYYKW